MPMYIFLKIHKRFIARRLGLNSTVFFLLLHDECSLSDKTQRQLSQAFGIVDLH